jgi:Sulfotransferase family/Tetratricopeptide repeat
MINEALLLDRQGRSTEAIAAYERLLESWPALPDCWYNLAVLQRKTRQFPEALRSYERALEHHVKRPEEVHLNRGVIYSDCLRQDESAERELKAALALNPNYLPALINLANLHEDLGRRQLASRCYERILALDPQSVPALARYAGLRTFTDRSDPLIDLLRQALRRTDMSVADRASIEFALGRALDGCQDYAAAFEVYVAANRHSRESAPPGSGVYDRALAEKITDQMIAAFPQVPKFPATPGAALKGTTRPIFVCGMYRSGSTLLEHLIAGHPLVAAGGELDYLPHTVQDTLAPFPASMSAVLPQRLKDVAAGYLGMLEDLFPGASYVTDKRPENYMNIGLIKTLFPDAKIVHTCRNALDNCLSIFFLHLDQRLSYALDLNDIAHHFGQYLRLMTHWQRMYGDDILSVDYDTLVLDPKPVMERLLGFLGLEWDERCLDVPAVGRSIKTASVWQVREPLHGRSSGRSRHYEKELNEIREYLDLCTRR